MKKLTAGIFIVMLGLVVADANAAVTSKAYVDAKVGDVAGSVETLETTVNTFKDGINTTITNQIKEELTSDTSEISKALAGKADNATTLAGYGITDAYTKTETDTKLGTKQNTLTNDANGTSTIAISADGKISTTAAVATTESVNTLAGRVTAAEGDIDTLQTTVAGLQNGEGSVANQIADALADYTNTEDMNTALAGKADKATTYTKTEVDTAVADAKKAGTDASAALTAYQTTNNAAVQKNASDITALQAKDTAIEGKIGTVAEGKTVVQMINEAAAGAEYDDAEVRGLISTNASGIAANKTAVEKAQSDATKGIADAAAAQTTANAAIPKPTGECSNPTNKCVLTFAGGNTYAWEVIEREGGQ